MLVLYFLFIALALAPFFWFRADSFNLYVGDQVTVGRAEAAEFAHGIAIIIFETTLFAVTLIAPAYAASAVADEKERQTLQLLLASPLSDREIVLGKAAGRLGFILAAAGAGLPLLALSMMFGGVSHWLLLVGCCLTISTAVLATAIGVHAGSASLDLRGALIQAYLVSLALVCGGFIPPMLFLTPFAVLIWLGTTPADDPLFVLVAVAYPIIQLAVASGFIIVAIQRLRPSIAGMAPRSRDASAAVEVPAAPGEDVSVIQTSSADVAPMAMVADEVAPAATAHADGRGYRFTAWTAESGAIVHPPVDDERPLLWKERYISGRTLAPGIANASALVGYAFGAIAIGLLILAVVAWINWLGEDFSNAPAHENRAMPTSIVLMACGAVAAGLYLIPVAAGMAAAVARERQRQTFDALLAMPLHRREILRAKVRAVLERNSWWWSVALLATGASFVVLREWWTALAVVVFSLAGLGLVVGLGAFLTIRCSTELRAFRFLMPVVVMVFGMPVAILNAINWDNEIGFGAILPTAAFIATASGMVFWLRACRELDRLG